MRAFTVKLSDVARCPDQNLSPSHWRINGTCLHEEWGACDYAGCDRPVWPNFDSMFCDQHQEDA